MFKAVLRTVVVVTTVACCCSAADLLAQKATPALRLEGYNGGLVIQSNSDRHEVTMTLTLSYKPEGKSNQIVFHIQQVGNASVPEWAGVAHLLVADGIVAVFLGGQQRGLLFKFPDTEVPSSFDRSTLDEIPMFGVARYGEHQALKLEEIDSLSRTGRGPQPASGFDPQALKVNPDPFFTDPGTSCVAGGPGSSSCGAGGCTVTCTSGNYACCQGGTCLCFVNPPK